MQMSSTTTWWLTFLMVAIQGATTITWSQSGLDPKILFWISQGGSYFTLLLTFAIHGTIPGVNAVSMPGTTPIVPPAVKVIIAFFAILLLSLLLILPASAQQPAKVAPKLTSAQVQQNPLLLLKQFSATDLQAALADANSQTPPDTTSSQCYTALLALVNSPINSPLPAGPGLFQALQKARDIKAFLANIQSPNGPLSQLNLACAPLLMDVNATLLALGIGTGLVAGGVAAGPAALPALPALGNLLLLIPK